MKAITIPRSGASFIPVLHDDVAEIERIHPTIRRCMCRQCGLVWEDTITSMQTVLDKQEVIDNIGDYYPEHVSCTDEKAWTHKEIQIGKRYLLNMRGYYPVVTVCEYSGDGWYKVLLGSEYHSARNSELLPWGGEKYSK